MPRATVSLEETERIDLKSCPEGFIVARRLTYGQKLERRAMSSTASMEGRAGSSKNIKMMVDMMNVQATIYDFMHCIVDHNLEDEAGNKLDLSNQAVVKSLHPRIAEEIEKKLDAMNNFEEDDEVLGN